MQSARQKIKVHPKHRRLEIIEREFFTLLDYKPETLTARLTLAIENLTQDYAENFSALQNEFVRRAFAVFARHTRNINTETLPSIEGRTQAMETFDRYCSLCGMLGSVRIMLLTDVKKSPHTLALAEEIGDILQATLIHKTDDGDEALHKCVMRFELKYGVYSAYELATIENVTYRTALDNLRDRLARIKDYFIQAPDSNVGACYRRAKELLSTLEEAYKQPDFNVAFCTAVAETAFRLLDKPKDVNLQQKFSRLARIAPGASSLLRKIGGYMLAFLGAAIVAASTLVTVFAPNPLIAAGYAAGVTLFGLGLFAAREKGFAKSLSAFAKAETKSAQGLQPIADTFGYAPGAFLRR